MAHTHNIYDTDRRFTIDPITRAIKNEFSTKNTVIQNDHNSERFTFELPRYIEGHDMSICNRVEVHFININSANQTESRGVYEVDDLQISADNKDVVVCSWLLSRAVTQYDGIMSFLLRFACVNGDVVDYAWNTAIYSNVAVAKGIYNSETYLDNYVDVLEQWKQQLFSINDDGVRNVTEIKNEALSAIETAAAAKQQEVLNSIPDDYKTLDANVTEYKAKVDSLANAIKGELSGTVVRADDVSPVEHTVSVNVRSKNLFDISKVNVTGPHTDFAYVSNVDDTSIIVTATETDNGYCGINETLRDICGDSNVGESYVFTANSTSGRDFIFMVGADKRWDFGTALVMSDELLDSKLVFYGIMEGAGNCTISNIQVELGSTATEYTPYVDPASVTVTKCGKNLVELSGFEFNDSNYTHILTGEDSPNALYEFLKVHTGESIVVSMKTTGEISGIKIGTIRYYNENNEVLCAIIPNVAHTILELPDSYKQVYIYGSSTGASVKDVQIEFGTTATDYEPYNGETFTPITDGTILDMKSLTPTMTLFTDAPGTLVECEYNRDTNAVITDLCNRLAALEDKTNG